MGVREEAVGRSAIDIYVRLRFGTRSNGQFIQKSMDVEMDASLTSDVVCVRLVIV